MRPNNVTPCKTIVQVGRKYPMQTRGDGFTQAHFMDKLSAEKKSTSRMESGYSVLDIEKLQQVADGYGCSVAESFMGGSADVAVQAQGVVEMLRPPAEPERESLFVL